MYFRSDMLVTKTASNSELFLEIVIQATKNKPRRNYVILSKKIIHIENVLMV